MIDIDEMRKLLAEQFGIKTDEELDEALKKIGGIRIGIFVDEPKQQVQAITATA